MSFESGSISCRFFTVREGIPDDAIPRFADGALPPIEVLKRNPISGWTTWRHLFDRDIQDHSARLGGYPYVHLVQAERKVPGTLLKAECRMEELALMKAEGRPFVRRQERADIRKQVMERLQPTMPPTLASIPLVLDATDQVACAGATTAKQTDALVLRTHETLGVRLVPWTPESLAAMEANASLPDLVPTCFVPGFELAGEPDSVGQDFLTWLWFVSEEEAATLGRGKDGVGVLIEGPLVFEFQGEGAYETALRKGTPAIAAEARTALLNGKKLRSAKVTLARGEIIWTTTFDADAFVFRSLKLPKGEATDDHGRFQERMLSLRDFRQTFVKLYTAFLAVRTAEKRWEQTCRAIFKWIDTRAAKG